MNAPTHSAFADTAEEAIALQEAQADPMTSDKATEVWTTKITMMVTRVNKGNKLEKLSRFDLVVPYRLKSSRIQMARKPPKSMLMASRKNMF